MEESRELSLEEIKELAVGGCGDIFEKTHPKITKKNVLAFRNSLKKKTLQEINEIAEKLVIDANKPQIPNEGVDVSGIVK